MCSTCKPMMTPAPPSYGASADYEDFYSSQFSKPDAFGSSAHTFGPNAGTIAPGGMRKTMEYFTELPSLKDLSFNAQQCLLIAGVVGVFYFFHLVFGDVLASFSRRTLLMLFIGVLLITSVTFYLLK